MITVEVESAGAVRQLTAEEINRLKALKQKQAEELVELANRALALLKYHEKGVVLTAANVSLTMEPKLIDGLTKLFEEKKAKIIEVETERRKNERLGSKVISRDRPKERTVAKIFHAMVYPLLGWKGVRMASAYEKAFKNHPTLKIARQSLSTYASPHPSSDRWATAEGDLRAVYLEIEKAVKKLLQ